MGQRIFQDGPAIESFRASNFDSLSAYGEVVDNSIQAHAKHIRIRFFVEEARHGRQAIQKVVFGDDGHGMSIDDLGSCLVLGWSSRYNDRDGIGRFGVGMTLAAIHECRKVEVYSRTKRGDWQYTYVDLDEISNGLYEEIPAPVVRRLPAEYDELSGSGNGSGSGTVVVWSKYDQQKESADTLIERTRIWMGRTYRYFIWEGDVEIAVNGQVLQAIDPLYARTEKTAFPGDPKAQQVTPIAIAWPDDKGNDSSILINMSLLPAAFRPNQGSGNAKETEKRQIHMNEGVSILRNRREVFYGPMPHWRVKVDHSGAGKGWSHFEQIDRWWGCEIHFDAVLDNSFSVRNIKQGALPNTELKKAIKRQIAPTRESFLEQIRELWKTNAQEKKDKEAVEGKGPGALPRHHEEAEKTAKQTPTPKGEIDRDKDQDIAIDEYVEEAGDRYDSEQQAAIRNLFKDQPFSIEDSSWKGPVFFEPKHLGGSAVLTYNSQHRFFEYLNSVLDDIASAVEEGADLGELARQAREVKVCIDLLLIAFVKGESIFSPADNYVAEEFFEHLRTNWGRFLQNYIKTREQDQAGN